MNGRRRIVEGLAKEDPEVAVDLRATVGKAWRRSDERA
jgi:hypothetical protein